MLAEMQHAVERVPVLAWAALLALITLGFGYRIASKNSAARTTARKPGDKKKRRTLIGFTGMGLVVLLGFGLSANTSIVFAQARLHMAAPWTLTVGLALEGIVLGLTLYSWAFDDKGTARAAYLLVFAQAIGAFEVVRFQHEDIGTALVRIVGPVMLAYGLHKMLGLEAKLGKIQITSDGILARLWTDQKNRLESRLGIGARGADAEAISRGNAADKFVHLNSVGKPKRMTERMYRHALVKSGRAALHGLEGFERQMAEAHLVDRIAYEKGMQIGGQHFEVALMRGVRSNTGPLNPDAAPPLGVGLLTSAAIEAAPQATPKTQTSRTATSRSRVRTPQRPTPSGRPARSASTQTSDSPPSGPSSRSGASADSANPTRPSESSTTKCTRHSRTPGRGMPSDPTQDHHQALDGAPSRGPRQPRRCP